MYNNQGKEQTLLFVPWVWTAASSPTCRQCYRAAGAFLGCWWKSFQPSLLVCSHVTRDGKQISRPTKVPSLPSLYVSVKDLNERAQDKADSFCVTSWASDQCRKNCADVNEKRTQPFVGEPFIAAFISWTNNSPQVHENIKFQSIYVPEGFTEDRKSLGEGDIDNSPVQMLFLCLSKDIWNSVPDTSSKGFTSLLLLQSSKCTKILRVSQCLNYLLF